MSRPAFNTPEWHDALLAVANRSWHGDEEAREELAVFDAEMDAHGVPSGRECLEEIKRKLEEYPS